MTHNSVEVINADGTEPRNLCRNLYKILLKVYSSPCTITVCLEQTVLFGARNWSTGKRAIVSMSDMEAS